MGGDREREREGKRLDLILESLCKHKRSDLLSEAFLVAEVWRREGVRPGGRAVVARHRLKRRDPRVISTSPRF